MSCNYCTFILKLYVFCYRMMKRLLQRIRSKIGVAPPLNIHDLSTADFSDDSDSGSGDNQVVMLSWNNGQVGIPELIADNRIT